MREHNFSCGYCYRRSTCKIAIFDWSTEILSKEGNMDNCQWVFKAGTTLKQVPRALTFSLISSHVWWQLVMNFMTFSRRVHFGCCRGTTSHCISWMFNTSAQGNGMGTMPKVPIRSLRLETGMLGKKSTACVCMVNLSFPWARLFSDKWNDSRLPEIWGASGNYLSEQTHWGKKRLRRLVSSEIHTEGG